MQTTSSRARRVLLPILNTAVILALWELAVDRRWINPLSLSSPSAALKSAMDSFDVMRPHIVATTYETLITFALSALSGILLGTLLVHRPRIRKAVYPSIVMFQLLPKIALAPLFIVWFGVEMFSRITFAGFITFFPVVLATMAGLQATDPLLLKLCRAVHASPAQVFWKVRLPSAVPFIMSGLKVAMTLAVTGVIVSEFVTLQNGLGYIILLASSNMQIELMFAAIGWVSIIGLALYGLVVALEWLVLKKLGAPMTGTLTPAAGATT